MRSYLIIEHRYGWRNAAGLSVFGRPRERFVTHTRTSVPLVDRALARACGYVRPGGRTHAGNARAVCVGSIRHLSNIGCGSPRGAWRGTRP